AESSARAAIHANELAAKPLWLTRNSNGWYDLVNKRGSADMSSIRSALVLLVAISSGAFAQTATSVIFGTVTDPTGAAVPNVPVLATSAATQNVERAVTNAA